MLKRNNVLVAAHVVAVAAAFAALASTSASARTFSSSSHVIQFPGSNSGSLANNVQNLPNIAKNLPGPSSTGGNLVNNVQNQPNIAKNFPNAPPPVGGGGSGGGWGGKYGPHRYGWIGGFASNDGDTCLEYRKIFDETGRYLGRQLINICQ